MVLSNRPDLCEYQCNGAMAAAKAYKKKPIDIANEVVAALTERSRSQAAAGQTPVFAEDGVQAVMPGFINLKVNPQYAADYMNGMQAAPKYGVEEAGHGETIIVDYGGANVAKPLHVGHLRSAVIGESIKRMGKFLGYDMIGDVHLGDWGLQMGLIIEELRDRKPELVYFDESYTGEFPKEPPFTISELEDIYPTASGKSKEDPAFKERAQLATYKLQHGYAPFLAIWKHIMSVSLADLKRNYDNLDVHFELWKGESNAEEFIPWLIQDLKDKGLARESQGALVVDIAEPTDSKELPLHRTEIRRRGPLRHLGSGDHPPERAGLSAGKIHLYHGQAAGAAFHPGVPGGKKGRVCAPGDAHDPHRLRHHERQGRQAL